MKPLERIKWKWVTIFLVFACLASCADAFWRGSLSWNTIVRALGAGLLYSGLAVGFGAIYLNTRTVLVSWVAILILSMVSAWICQGAFLPQSSNMSLIEVLSDMGMKTYFLMLVCILVIRGAYTFK
tara:strand:- start:2292 stop:2669 length:378 start_codon:yes stop_codon:yes gene_type:complete